MAYETIIVDISDHVALITLNRPDALNALNAALLGELADALEDADANDKVRAIVITGSEKAFAAGADITEMAEQSFVDMYRNESFGSFDRRVGAIRKPIIAAVSGYALGGGCELAMMCDFIIASEDAKFGQPEINLGVIAGIGGTQRLTHAIGKAKSMDMHLTGRMMGAEEAERSGLVSRVVPGKKLKEEALNAANRISGKSLIASMAAKEAVNTALETSLAEGIRFEKRLFQALFSTEDQKEGMEAFREKREPQFRDK
ncbi:MAG: enoyl-CoA hydratase [Rhodobacterales bacterium]|nr:MAG: enoyl-CoA hydratase [Rhodobacterales bacterium]